jgi:hypothetical protein
LKTGFCRAAESRAACIRLCRRPSPSSATPRRSSGVDRVRRRSLSARTIGVCGFHLVPPGGISKSPRKKF